MRKFRTAMLGIVIVTYKSYDRIYEYVKEDLLAFVSNGRGKLVIVDVGSDYPSSERIAELLFSWNGCLFIQQ